MPIPLFNMLNGQSNNSYYYQTNKPNIVNQLAMVKKNPGLILDILLQNQKINQQQYNELQPYKNNPVLIGQYLINNGRSNEINMAQQEANEKFGK